MSRIGKAKHRFYSGVASALTMVAVFVVNSASPLFVYRGETPEELLK
ncbi:MULTISPECIES: cyclic lactone autoinducer peptide [Paenibacillus]|jgi:cyclic lactone autoinducer peptide|uniref:Cyclic lactone autoinducer peptide n=1 Tax=Paenibacillus ihbetae TaxID=1870820 RepID=A0ABX3JTJ7_9BACL|nr:cyclic lactone autoinducer peptide [Paenibacillus ihbetae]OOC60610.1 hypothetical protein BBD40_01175 [Paenibacillus ihbetae]